MYFSEIWKASFCAYFWPHQREMDTSRVVQCHFPTTLWGNPCVVKVLSTSRGWSQSPLLDLFFRLKIHNYNMYVIPWWPQSPVLYLSLSFPPSIQDAFRHIDYEIPIRLINLAHTTGVSHCSLLTSYGSNPNSWLLYPRTKGEMENSVTGLEFNYTSIFRPGLLNRGGRASFVEKVASKMGMIVCTSSCD